MNVSDLDQNCNIHRDLHILIELSLHMLATPLISRLSRCQMYISKLYNNLQPSIVFSQIQRAFSSAETSPASDIFRAHSILRTLKYPGLRLDDRTTILPYPVRCEVGAPIGLVLCIWFFWPRCIYRLVAVPVHLNTWRRPIGVLQRAQSDIPKGYRLGYNVCDDRVELAVAMGV